MIFAVFLALDITHMQLQNIAINSFYECNFSLMPFMFYPDKICLSICRFLKTRFTEHYHHMKKIDIFIDISNTLIILLVIFSILSVEKLLYDDNSSKR